jgi:hypothetical protein
MPRFFLQGLLPPPGERPVASLTVIGRTLRQIPAEGWRGRLQVSAIVIPPVDSEMVRDMMRGQRLFDQILVREGDSLLVLNPVEVLERLRRLPDGDNGAQAFMATLRMIYPELHKYMTKLPISACIKMVGEVRQYARALELIDRVHKIPAIKVLDIKPVSVEELEGGVAAVILKAPFAPFRFVEPNYVGLAMPAETPISSILHEVGHLIDLEAIGTRGLFSSTIGEDVLSEWWDAVSQSRTYQRMMQVVERMRRMGDRDLANAIEGYYATRHELFARSYAQYIAVRTGDRQAMAELEQKKTRRVPGLYGVYEIPLQWDDDDFRSIAEAFDRLFERLGWR